MLTHTTTTTLLNLKWRFMPRLLYYTNILLYIALLVIYSLYTNMLTGLNDSGFSDGFNFQFHVPLIVLFGLNILKIVIQVLFSDGKIEKMTPRTEIGNRFIAIEKKTITFAIK